MIDAGDIENCLAPTAKMLHAESMRDAADLLRVAQATVEQTGHDNWNGGTTVYTIYLQVDAGLFARIGDKRKALEAQINERLKHVIEQRSSDWYSVKLAPKIQPRSDWRQRSTGELSRERRLNIFDGMKIEGVIWCGQLNDVEFLERVFDLKALPSHDTRFDSAAGDIWQHRFNNDDWDVHWVFEDTRFRLLDGVE